MHWFEDVVFPLIFMGIILAMAGYCSCRLLETMGGC